MNKYAEVALKAATLLGTHSPQKAWEDASYEIFPDSQSSREKACPKSMLSNNTLAKNLS